MAAEDLPILAPASFNPGIIGLTLWEICPWPLPQPGLYPCDTSFVVCSNTALI